MADFTLVIGNKNYSSWSLRGWLMVKAAGAPFEEVLVRLGLPTTRAEVLKHSPSARVPVLKHGALTIWETIAIGEYLAETFPQARMWPQDAEARALARSVSAEMHAGFAGLRKHFPMNVRSTFPNRGSTPEVQSEIDRVTAIWHDCRTRFGKDGAFLFGGFTIADAMYAPVVTRFRTYKAQIDPESQAYCDAVWNLPAMQEWAAEARKERWVLEDSEF